jgi:adenosylcobinamide-GDP ribazoletransferase
MREYDTTANTYAMDFAVALSLLSRLPVTTLIDIPQAAWARQANAVWTFPFVGVVIGSIAAMVGYGAILLGLPATLAAGCVLAALMACTGAMHEDGLADCADGFWGGWTTERRLDIMKDSQIGTYGVVSLGLVTGARWLAYAALLQTGVIGVVAVAAMSRGLVPAVMAALPHAKSDGLSRSVGQPLPQGALLAAALGLVIGVLCLGLVGITAMIVAALAVAALAKITTAKIGGQTGDVLGASQQIGELAILLVLVAVM